MRPITNDRPKPMVPILGRPFLEYQIEQLRDQGFERVLMLLGYLPSTSFRIILWRWHDWGVRIEYSVTEPDQLTSSRKPALALDISIDSLSPSPALFLSTITGRCKSELVVDAVLPGRGKPASITVYSNKDGYSRGSVQLDQDGHVRISRSLAHALPKPAGSRNQLRHPHSIPLPRSSSSRPGARHTTEEGALHAARPAGRPTAYVSDHRSLQRGARCTGFRAQRLSCGAPRPSFSIATAS